MEKHKAREYCKMCGKVIINYNYSAKLYCSDYCRIRNELEKKEREKKEKKINKIEKCNCGRPWCQYFAPGADEGGMSFSKEELEHEIINQKEIIELAKSNINIIKKILTK